MARINYIPSKVSALNAASKACNEYAPQVVELLKKWIAKKITLGKNGRAVKFDAEYSKLNLPSLASLRVHLDSKYNYAIWINVSARVWGEEPGSNQSVDCAAIVGDVTDGILRAVYEYEPKKCDWTAQEIEQSLMDLESLEKQCDAIKKNIPFCL